MITSRKRVEFFHKIQSLRTLLKDQDKRGLVISDYGNLCWLGIGRPNVLSLSEAVVVRLLITFEEVFLVTNNIETSRIVAEEIDRDIRDCFHVLSFNWYEHDPLLKFWREKAIINDSEVESEIQARRMVLTESTLEQATLLGQDAVTILEHTLRYIKKGRTEREISAEMVGMCVEKGIDVGLALCASERRMLTYRHPIPTDAPIGDMALVALTLRRNGLYTCLSRIVSLVKPCQELLRKRDAVLTIDCAYQYYTREGVVLADLFDQIKEVYREVGFPDEWKNHHQGGPSGYKGREQKVNQDTKIVVKNGMLFCYNPTVPGYKAEDSFFLKAGKQVVTTFAENLALREVVFCGERYIKPDIIRLD